MLTVLPFLITLIAIVLFYLINYNNGELLLKLYVNGAKRPGKTEWDVMKYFAKTVGKRHIMVARQKTLNNLIKIDDSWYIKNGHNVFVKCWTPCRSEDGLDIVEITHSGSVQVKRKNINNGDSNFGKISTEDWIRFFASYDDDLKCYFYHNRQPSLSESISYDTSSLDHRPKNKTMQSFDCHVFF